MDARTRLGWIELYRTLGNAGVVCRRCGISRPTLRKWWRRYQVLGIAGLEEESRRPRHSPARKVFDREEELTLQPCRERSLGIKQLRIELIREHAITLALDTIHKVLVRHGESRLKRGWVRPKVPKRYSRPIPGDRVQVDVCKVGPSIYQYTAVDDCSRFMVVGIYTRRTTRNTVHFLDRVLEEMPFPVQRIQTDRGQEFFAYLVQDQLHAWHVKFRPIRPRSTHLNGKVERAQRTTLEEFWSTVDLAIDDLQDRLDEWQHFSNWQRPHGALGGRSPIDGVGELLPQTPLTEAVWDAYDPAREPIRTQDRRWDATAARMQR